MKKTLISLLAFTLSLSVAVSAYAADGASLSLQTDAETVKVGDTFKVQVLIDTAGATTDEVDVSISYDPLALEVLDGMADLDGEQISEDTSLLEVYIDNEIDSPNGTLFFEQTSLDPNEYYKTEGEPEVLAEFEVRALKSGSATMTLVLTEGEKESDSSIKDSESQEDVLAVINNLQVDIEDTDTADDTTDESDVVEDTTDENTEEETNVLASLELQANQTKVSANGTDTVNFTVVAKDADGNPVTGESLLFSASNEAQLSALTGTTDDKGEVSLVMTAPNEAGTVQVQVYSSTNAELSATQNITVEEVVEVTPEVVEEVVEEPQVAPENVSAGPDTLDAVGAGTFLAGILALIAMMFAYTLQFKKN